MRDPKQLGVGTVLFVCEHGALRSRIAAAYFNAAPPPGWRATSAGREPQSQVSPHVARLLTDQDVPSDGSPPRAVAGIQAERVVAIDCDVAGAEQWKLASAVPDERLRDEIRERVARFARKL